MDSFGPNSGAPGHRLYGTGVLDHFENPRNVGEVVDPDAASWVESPVHGDRLKLTLRIEGGRIAEARFRAFGCGAAIASSSMATVLLTGRSLEDAARLTREEVAEALGGLPESKVHCSVLAEEAVRRALEEYGKRQGAAEPGTAPRHPTSVEKESI
jgi:nitrogen fixation NifU-like protein